MSSNKRFIVTLSVASLLSSVLIAGLALLLLLNDGPFSIVADPVGGMKVCTMAVVVHCLLNFLLYSFYSPDALEDKFHFQVMNIAKCCCLLILACIVFHAIAVCFGAPVLTSTSETFHFAMLLAVSVCLPCCLFYGPNVDSWMGIFITNSSHTGMETVVYFTSIGALIGSWLGAVPIPLDWDRPWQEWPISCVIGAVGGYSGGLLLSAVQIPRKYRALHKSKFF